MISQSNITDFYFKTILLLVVIFFYETEVLNSSLYEITASHFYSSVIIHILVPVNKFIKFTKLNVFSTILFELLLCKYYIKKFSRSI